MRWTASAATSSGPTTRRIGNVARSCSRRASSWSPSREADELSLQVVEGSVQRRARGVLAFGQPRLDLLERERVVAEERRVLLEVSTRGRRRLAVPLDRSRLAEPRHAVVPELDLDDVGLVARLSGDDERLGEP